jgi:hypothetical protein
MTPTRALVGLAAVAAAGYAVIHSVGGQEPQYIGDFPSIQEQAQAEPPPVTHDAGAPQPSDPQHYAADPVTPEAAPGAPAGPAGPGAVPPAGPAGGGGTGGQGGYPPAGPGNPLAGGLTPLTDLLSGLVNNLPALDAQGFCRLATGQVVALPCDQVPPLPTQAPALPTEVPAP